MYEDKKVMYILKDEVTDTYKIGSSTDYVADKKKIDEYYGVSTIIMSTVMVNDVGGLNAYVATQYANKQNSKGWYVLTPVDLEILRTLPSMLTMHHHDKPYAELNTLDDLCKYVSNISGTKIQHSKVLKKIRGWPPELIGELTTRQNDLRSINNVAKDFSGHGGSIANTVYLSKRQCVIIAGTFNMSVQLAVIDKLQYMESTYAPEDVSQSSLSMIMLEHMSELTLYGVCNYVYYTTGKLVDHSKLRLRKLKKWHNTPGFGNTTSATVSYKSGNGATRVIKTNILTPRQCVAVAGSISLQVQCTIVDRLHALETLYEPYNPTTQDTIEKAIRIYRKYVDSYDASDPDKQVTPQGVTILETMSTSTGHKFWYKPGHFILNPMSDSPKLCID